MGVPQIEIKRLSPSPHAQLRPSSSSVSRLTSTDAKGVEQIQDLPFAG